MTFVDDEPVELDCGCCCDEGFFSIQSIKVYNRETRNLDNVEITYCYDDDECMAKAYEMKLNLRKYMEYTEGHVKTAYEKECEYGDYLYDGRRGN